MPSARHPLSFHTEVVTKENAQPFRHGQDPLPVVNRRKNFLSQAYPQHLRPLLIAGRAAAALPTRKRHEKLFTAIRTAHPRKSLPQIPALYILVDRSSNDRPPKSIFRLEPLCVNTLELVEMVTHQREKGRSLRIARPVHFYHRSTHAIYTLSSK